MRMNWLLLFALAATLASCGDPGKGTEAIGATGQLITIRNYQSFPQSLTVVAGSSVLVRNEDGLLHSVTSEVARGRYSPGGVEGVSFDTGAFTGTSTISIPANAKPGTIVPYYCEVHGAAEVNEGELVIAAP